MPPGGVTRRQGNARPPVGTAPRSGASGAMLTEHKRRAGKGTPTSGRHSPAQRLRAAQCSVSTRRRAGKGTPTRSGRHAPSANGASGAMLIEQRAGTSSRGHGVCPAVLRCVRWLACARVRQFDNIGNMKATTHRNFEMVDPGSADGCWVDVLTEPIVEGLTRLPRSVLANDFRSVGTAVCCGHGSSRVGSPHVRLLRTLSRQRTRHCRCLEENHHAAAPCPESHRS